MEEVFVVREWMVWTLAVVIVLIFLELYQLRSNIRKTMRLAGLDIRDAFQECEKVERQLDTLWQKHESLRQRVEREPS